MSLQIQQIKCPNCGGQLNSVGPFSPTKVCNYCHSEFHVSNTDSTEKDIPTPERIITFSTTKEDFEKEVLKLLADQPYAPNDIFDQTAFKEAEGIYLPMFLYEGRYECSWNCSVGYYENEVVANSSGDGVKNQEVLKYKPQNGTTKNNYAVVCAAYEGPEIKPELIEYARAYLYDAIQAKKFSPELLEGYNFVVHNLDKETTWSKYGIDSIKYLAEEESVKHIPGEDWKDFSCSVSTDEKHDGRMVYIPFWMVYYEYNNENHYVIMDGSGTNEINGTAPIDQERVSAVDKWFDIAKYTKWAAFASFLLIFTDFRILIVVAWVAYFGLKFYAQMNEEKIIEDNRKVRETKLNEILASA